METEAESKSVGDAADDHLRLGVLAADRRHVATALLSRVYVGHAGGLSWVHAAGDGESRGRNLKTINRGAGRKVRKNFTDDTGSELVDA